MTDIAIRVENLSKLYTIGRSQQRHDTLRDALSGFWPRIPRISRKGQDNSSHSSNSWPKEDTDLWALRDVSFEVQRGEVVGVIGRNGAGKSTLLKILSRITEPTSGRAEIHGRIASLLEVGTGFHPELTGRENIYLNGAILGMKRREIEARFDEIVAFAEIERFLDTPVKRYSSGMYVRLAFAVAAHLEPEILLVDEVLAVGDAAFQKKCLGKMGDVAEEGRTVLFVSHNMVAIQRLCPVVIQLSEGHVQSIGSASDVINGYLATGISHPSADNKDGPPLAATTDNLVTLHRVSYHNSAGHPTYSIQSGADLEIAIEVTSRSRIDRFSVSLGINDLIGSRMAVLHSDIASASISLIAGRTTILCRIPKIPLLPGQYRVDVKLIVGSNVAIWLPEASQLTIEPGDFFGTGRLPDSSWAGNIYLYHTWSIDHVTR